MQPRSWTAIVAATAAALLIVSLDARAQTSQRDSGAGDWRRGATCYEIFVRSFRDSDGDGIGDLNGLIEKLDYVNDGDSTTTGDLGARCIWLMPVAESPSYHGYDATNYYRVEPDYGTNDDFKRFVAAAHRRGVRVLVDMVLNHASSEHPYFQAALRDTASPYRGWFRWSRTKPDEKGPWGQEVWHRSPVRDEYYYGIFWSGMPDLNYENPAVRAEAVKVARFWLDEMGVDGFRLDAVPYLVEERHALAGTRATHELLRQYADSVRRIAPSAFTVGEVWDSVGAMLPYYPDQLDAYFAFAASDAIVDAVRTGKPGGILPVYRRLLDTIPPVRFAPFLRNHDQTRTMTALGGDPARARLAATLLLTLPGLPFVYYGEEIGMTGDKPDERIRTPMQWSRTAHGGFTTGTPWEPLQPDSLGTTVEAQDRDRASLLSHYRRLIHLRASHPALGGSDLVALRPSAEGVIAYLRRASDEMMLVVANLGDRPVSGVVLSAPGSVLPPGRYAGTDLLDESAAPVLYVAADGRLRGYPPAAVLGPREARVIALVQREE